MAAEVDLSQAFVAVLINNPLVRRLLAACLLVTFAALATVDMVDCPDGCQSASSPSSADRCNASGACIFCTGGVVVGVTEAPITQLIPIRSAAELPSLRPPLTPTSVLEHPPRTV